MKYLKNIEFLLIFIILLFLDGLDEIEMSPLIGVLIGVVASMVIICLVAMIVIKLRVDRYDDSDKGKHRLNKFKMLK